MRRNQKGISSKRSKEMPSTTYHFRQQSQHSCGSIKSGSKALYECEITRMSKTARTRQRAAATLGCWKKKRKLRSPKILMALLEPGPRMGPDLAIPGGAIANLRRTLLRYPEFIPACRRIWEARQIPARVKPNSPGPVGILHAELA